MRPPAQAHGAIIASADTCDQIACDLSAAIETSAPAAISAATTAACVAGRRPAILAVNHPATSANTAPQTMLATSNAADAVAWGYCPESRKRSAPGIPNAR